MFAHSFNQEQTNFLYMYWTDQDVFKTQIFFNNSKGCHGVLCFVCFEAVLGKKLTSFIMLKYSQNYNVLNVKTAEESNNP